MIKTANGEDPHLEADLRAVVAVRSRGLNSHPTPDELVEYHFRTLSAEEAERVEDHLTLCPECSQVVLDLAAFSRPAEEETAPAAIDLDREWERMEARRERGTGSPEGRPSATRDGLVWALAASVLVALGLFGWNLGLRRDLGAASRPRADFAMADLAPEGERRARTTEVPARVRVLPEQGRVLLLLNLGDLREFPSYRMELVDPGRGVVWAQSRVLRGEDGTFLLEIPTRMLESKVYQVRLSGERGRERTALAGYSFEVVGGGPPVLPK